MNMTAFSRKGFERGYLFFRKRLGLGRQILEEIQNLLVTARHLSGKG